MNLGRKSGDDGMGGVGGEWEIHVAQTHHIHVAIFQTINKELEVVSIFYGRFGRLAGVISSFHWVVFNSLFTFFFSPFKKLVAHFEDIHKGYSIYRHLNLFCL